MFIMEQRSSSAFFPAQLRDSRLIRLVVNGTSGHKRILRMAKSSAIRSTLMHMLSSSMLSYSYVSRDDAFAKNLTYFENNGSKVIMKGDDYTWLDYGAYRNS
jgi:hypothetical protein